jgi:haloalkane dehalogenase
LRPEDPGAAEGAGVLAALREDARPLLLLWGAEDRPLPPAYGEAFAGALGKPAPQLVAGAGHYLQEDQGELIGATIADWLASS